MDSDTPSPSTTPPTPESNIVNWPHAPPHFFDTSSTFFVTGSTYLKARLFHDETRLHLLHIALLRSAQRHGWQLEGWAVFTNHYHFIARPSSAPSLAQVPTTLQEMVTHLHRSTATELNRMDNSAGRKVWHNFWDKKLTFEKSYMARLNYVHHNPVKHRLVAEARAYPWCSAAWFERTASPAWIKSVYAFKTDKLNIADDY